MTQISPSSHERKPTDKEGPRTLSRDLTGLSMARGPGTHPTHMHASHSWHERAVAEGRRAAVEQGRAGQGFGGEEGLLRGWGVRRWFENGAKICAWTFLLLPSPLPCFRDVFGLIHSVYPAFSDPNAESFMVSDVGQGYLQSMQRHQGISLMPH